jgi:riboflavin biosynthesis pyrimidine reductase
MASSVDGRLLTERWTKPPDGINKDTLFGHYDTIHHRFKADGWMVGRKTMAGYAKGTARSVAPTSDLRKTFIGNRNERDVAVAIDLRGKLHYGQDHVAGDHVIAILGNQVSDEYLSELQHDGVSYLFVESAGQDAELQSNALSVALDTLGDTFGINTLLLEGGGIMNGTFLKAGLIDEISLLVYPAIDGLAGIPSIVEYLGNPDELPAAGQSLRRLTTETLEGGVVWIHYVLEGRIEPGQAFERITDLDAAPDGYGAMNEREAIKAMVKP